MKVQERIERMTISADSTIREAMGAIDRGVMGTALLADPESGRFCGLVTDGDLRRALLKGHGLEANVDVVDRPETRTARAGTPVEEITAFFSGQVRLVPLLDERDIVVDLAIFDQRLRLPVAEPTLGEQELKYVTECVVTGWISSAGKFVTGFERIFAEFCDTEHAIATSSGTTALHLALLAIGVGPGDEVIVPTLTFIATANAVTYCGADLVLVDSEAESWNLDPDAVEAAITPRTKAIIPVHLYGHPANMEPIMATANQHGIAVVEDAAEAHGAEYQGRIVGSIGRLGVFSFYGNKIVTTGEGGMITTNDDELANRIRMLRDHGMSKERRYWHPMLGYNYRLTNLQAAIGVAQMEKIEAILAAKRRVSDAYRQGLQVIPGLIMPPEAEWATNVNWLFSILVDEETFGLSRDRLMSVLRSHGIDSRPLFPPVHTQPIYERAEHHPVAEHLAATGMSLPSATRLQTEDVEKVVAAIAKTHHSAHV